MEATPASLALVAQVVREVQVLVKAAQLGEVAKAVLLRLLGVMAAMGVPALRLRPVKAAKEVQAALGVQAILLRPITV